MNAKEIAQEVYLKRGNFAKLKGFMPNTVVLGYDEYYTTLEVTNAILPHKNPTEMFGMEVVVRNGTENYIKVGYME